MIRCGRSCALLAIALAGCSGIQTSLGGEGADGASFIRLFALFLIVCGVMYALVIAALVAALAARRANRPLTVEGGAHHQSSPLLRSALIGWAALVAIGLIGLTLASFLADHSAAA